MKGTDQTSEEQALGAGILRQRIHLVANTRTWG